MTTKDKALSMRIKQSTKLKLDAIGNKTESYDDIVKRLIEEYEINHPTTE